MDIVFLRKSYSIMNMGDVPLVLVVFLLAWFEEVDIRDGFRDQT